MSGKIISVHLYRLRPGVEPGALLAAARAAAKAGLFSLDGLEAWRFGAQVRGRLSCDACSIWVYSSQEAWQRLWGTAGSPVPPEEYPAAWRAWEKDYLAPLLDRPPDKIDFASFQIWDELQGDVVASNGD